MMEGRAPKGWTVRPLKRYVSWVQTVARQVGLYPQSALGVLRDVDPSKSCYIPQKCGTEKLAKIGEILYNYCRGPRAVEDNTEGRRQNRFFEDGSS